MTKLVKYFDPFGPWPSVIPSNLFKSIEDLLFDFDSKNQSWNLSKGFPKGDLFIEDDKAVIEFGLAGYSKDQLSVVAQDNKLTISATKCEDDGASKPRNLARRAVSEEVVFGKQFEPSKAEVSYENGLLRIVVPKVQQSEKSVISLKIK